MAVATGMMACKKGKSRLQSCLDPPFDNVKVPDDEQKQISTLSKPAITPRTRLSKDVCIAHGVHVLLLTTSLISGGCAC